MRDYKKTNAPESTITFDREKVQGDTENIYEAIAVIARRADQINAEIKQELIEKLDEFATHNDSLEEVFENKEQIEVSRFYERLPKPSSIAIKEWLDGDIYYRNPIKEEK
ncbi:MAG: DNA-directed RNA polymerase subunit omega [Lutimonas sp.]|jgi:DNA-directed RNA polymerase subunit K/omega